MTERCVTDMIAYVQGVVADITEDNVVLDVNGFGINVKISARVAAALPGIGERVKLHTYTLVREDAFLLYGFLQKGDLDIFKKCIMVNGIGPKGALAILSVMDADTLRYAILSKDAKAIAKAPGIGQKTAERLILDLKDKLSYDDALIDREVSLSNHNHLPQGEAVQETLEALVALGYGQTESMQALSKIPDTDKKDSSILLKEALKYLF